MLRSLWTLLEQQHAIDMQVYQTVHKNVGNRCLHYVLVPLEVASFLWLLTVVSLCLGWKRKSAKGAERNVETPPILLPLLVTATGGTMGILSYLVAKNRLLGLVVLLLHGLWIHVCPVWVKRLGWKHSCTIGISVWGMSWALQVGVGHLWMEQNLPNLLSPEDNVSLLSMATSIVLAWQT